MLLLVITLYLMNLLVEVVELQIPIINFVVIVELLEEYGQELVVQIHHHLELLQGL